jgi:hypothetical protein
MNNQVKGFLLVLFGLHLLTIWYFTMELNIGLAIFLIIVGFIYSNFL